MEGDGQGQGSAQPQGGGDGKDEQGQGSQGGARQEESFDKERALATILAQRESENQLKGRVRELSEKLRSYEDAGKSEMEKLSAKLAEKERRALELEQRVQHLTTRSVVEKLAARKGFTDPDIAYLAIDRAALQFSDEGEPTEDSVTAALDALAKAKPHLVGQGSNGRADGGVRRTSPTGTDMNERLRQALGSR